MRRIVLDKLEALYEQGTLPQALLFIDGRDSATPALLSLTKKMLGNIPHPDYIVFNETSIKVDDIRLLQEKLIHTPYCTQHYVVFFEKLEVLNIAAMNALLKILEEPTRHVYFFAVTHRVDLIIPTVLSRFQKWYCPHNPVIAKSRSDGSNPDVLVTTWLQYMRRDISSYQLTEQWVKYPLQTLGEQLYGVLAEMIRVSHGADSVNDDALSALNQLIPLARKYSLLEKLTRMLRQLHAGVALQGATFIESWLSWEEHG